MKEACIGRDQALIADDQPPKVPQPGKRPLDEPSPPIAPQLAPILRGGALTAAPGGDDRLTPSPGPSSMQRIAGIPPIGAQAPGPLARVFARRVTSAGDAASRDAPNGGPGPSTRTLHVVPWPHVVFPTSVPLFWRG
jgi:hypothetical protein